LGKTPLSMRIHLSALALFAVSTSALAVLPVARQAGPTPVVLFFEDFSTGQLARSK
jgi:hypothetical protein